MDNSSEAVICMLACIKACRTYIVIDPYWPAKYVKEILTQTDYALIITENKWAKQLDV